MAARLFESDEVTLSREILGVAAFKSIGCEPRGF